MLEATLAMDEKTVAQILEAVHDPFAKRI